MRVLMHQLDDLNKMLDDVKRAADEGIDQPTDKSEAVKQLADDYKTVAQEKRCE
jgi:hypothetical protein